MMMVQDFCRGFILIGIDLPSLAAVVIVMSEILTS